MEIINYFLSDRGLLIINAIAFVAFTLFALFSLIKGVVWIGPVVPRIRKAANPSLFWLVIFVYFTLAGSTGLVAVFSLVSN